MRPGKPADEFDLVYSKRQSPSEMKTFRVTSQGNMKLSGTITAVGMADSRTEAERLIKQGAVEWNGARITNPAQVNSPGDYTLRVGKKPAIRVVIESS